MFTQYHKTQLKDLVRPKIGDFYQGTVNIRLNDFISRLQEQCPENFHQDTNSLRTRVFFDEPTYTQGSLPMAGFIKPIKGWRSE